MRQTMLTLFLAPGGVVSRCDFLQVPGEGDHSLIKVTGRGSETKDFTKSSTAGKFATKSGHDISFLET